MLKSLIFGTISAVTLGGAADADVSISNKPTQNMNCTAGVCTATAKKAVLNVNDLQTMLAAGDATVATGSLAKDIEIDQPLTWSSISRLTLDARRSVVVKKPVIVAGTGALTVDWRGQGELAIEPKGSIQFWDLGSSLIIHGHSYTLVGDLMTLAADVADKPKGLYALAKPYDAGSDGTYSSAVVRTDFAGTFEGLGNAISNLTIRLAGQHSDAGLFKEIVSGSSIRDLALLDVNFGIQTCVSRVGAVAANNNGGVLLRLHATGTIATECTAVVGGLVGANQGPLSKSSTNMQIKIKMAGDAGGEQVGGLAAENWGTIDQSYSSTRVFGSHSWEVGGLVGYNGGGEVTNAYAVSPVQAGGGYSVGGLIGMHQYGSVSASYSTGPVVARKKTACGGLIGYAYSTVSQSYWDSDTSKCGGVGQPLTDQQLKSGLPDGFDPNIWGQSPNINNGYPYLLANPPK
ncbi:MAG: hypothetical protein JO056_09065 [Alphaproteobacteria bacterium]|nr:hypothetical protein [Alphaproteobacteria bacterium]